MNRRRFPDPPVPPIVTTRTKKRYPPLSISPLIPDARTPRIHPLTPRVHPTHRLQQQEAKKEDRLAREEFALTGGNKKLTKKERKRLEQEE